jgi:hypothetical protein
MEREFVELWLSKKVQAAERQQAAILGWARIAAWLALNLLKYKNESIKFQ